MINYFHIFYLLLTYYFYNYFLVSLEFFKSLVKFKCKIEIYHDLGEKVTSIEDLISKVYPDEVLVEKNDYQWMCQKTILTVRNSNVDEMNNIIQSKLPRDSVNYISIDNIMDQEDSVHY
jgi:hypothetical protein